MQSSRFAQGAIIGAGVMGVFAAIAHLVVVMTSTGPTMMGADAERWTAESVKDLLPHGWRLINHVSLDQHGDVDHVLIGPGGVLLLETKWSAVPWTTREGQRLDRGVHWIESKAAQFARWHEIKQFGGSTVVEPLVVLWGPIGEFAGRDAIRLRRDGAIVLHGSRLRDWALRRGRTRLSNEQVHSIWEALARHAEYTDASEPEEPPSLTTIALRVLGGFLGGLASFLLLASLLPHLPPPAWWAAVAATTAVALRIRRWEFAAPYATGVCAGSGAIALLWIAAVAMR